MHRTQDSGLKSWLNLFVTQLWGNENLKWIQINRAVLSALICIMVGNRKSCWYWNLTNFRKALTLWNKHFKQMPGEYLLVSMQTCLLTINLLLTRLWYLSITQHNYKKASQSSKYKIHVQNLEKILFFFYFCKGKSAIIYIVKKNTFAWHVKGKQWFLNGERDKK